MMWAAIALTMVATSAVTGCSSDNDGSYEEPKPVIDPVEPPTTMELSRGEQIAQFIKYGVMAYDGFMLFHKLRNNFGSILNIFRR